MEGAYSFDDAYGVLTNRALPKYDVAELSLSAEILVINRKGKSMPDIEKPMFFELIESQVARLGGGTKRGVVTKQEMEEAQEIRVSIRLPSRIGSTELFTLRNIPPENYHLMLIAIPRVQHRKAED